METDRYRGAGIKLTPQRLAVIEYLEGDTDHPSVLAIYKALAKRFSSMTIATVYNIIKALKKRGLVAEFTDESGKKRIDPNTRPHHHLVCMGCGRVVDIPSMFRPRISARERAGFEIMGSRVEFFGRCPLCKKKKDRR